MLSTIWDIYQSHQISKLNEKVSDVQISRTQDNDARDVAFGLEEKVDKLALICRAMFELIQESSGISDEQLRNKMSPKFGRCLFCGYKDEAAGPLP